MKPQSIKLSIKADGEIQAIYSDQLADLCDQGEATITRASDVEPHPAGGWVAHMRPPFPPCRMHYRLREQALAAEVDYLEKQLGL